MEVGVGSCDCFLWSIPFTVELNSNCIPGEDFSPYGCISSQVSPRNFLVSSAEARELHYQSIRVNSLCLFAGLYIQLFIVCLTFTTSSTFDDSPLHWAVARCSRHRVYTGRRADLYRHLEVLTYVALEKTVPVTCKLTDVCEQHGEPLKSRWSP